MKTNSVAWFLLAATSLSAQLIRFDDSPAGILAGEWTAGMTHKGGVPKWEILPDASAPSKPNVLAQTSTDSTGGRFPFAIYNGAMVRDGSVSVRFKAVSGRVDQAAGIIWRFRDADNYYIVRANALEDNVVLYKVEKGERISLAPKNMPSRTYGVKHTVPKQRWNALKVEFKGTSFSVYFDGQKIMEVEDSTFSQAGKTGLWTKADSVTYFDDFQVADDGKR
ncbi:MAG: DUF1080 domain-containing protein [Acidobacteria bacterium]|nr:DUF1080 domain-containing protein [Acidobacteriota bacterium]